jgi:AcrR family transcriptional regulator
MQVPPPSPSSSPAPLPPDRPDAILDAAFGVFASYGYRRTTIEDIARAAAMSRTAFYLHYRNKEDVFRSLVARHFDRAAQDMALALAAPGGDAAATLHAAFRARDGAMMEAVLAAPHGAELLDAGSSVAADLVARGEARVAGVLAGWLAGRYLPADLGPPGRIAAAILAALKGLKHEAGGPVAYRAGQEQLARLFGRALQG